MKILYHHRTLGDGAEGIHIAEMVQAFRTFGHNVKVIAPIGEKPNKNDKKVSVLSRIKKLVPKITYEFLEIAYNLYGYYLLREEVIRRRPDFIYDRYITFNASAVLIGRRHNIPVILEVNAPLAWERSEQKDERLYLKSLAFFLERWICSNSYKTVVVSTSLKDYLISQGVPSEKIIIIPNGVDTEKFKPKGKKDGKLLKECGFTEENVIVGFIGILRPWHGLELLLQSFSLVARNKESLRLLILGDGPIRPEIEKIIRNMGLSSKVSITGRIPHARVPDYVNLFDIAVSPKATFYASPMKILEYMASGKAAVAPDMKNIRDIIVDKLNGVLFAAGDSFALADKLKLITDDKAYREQLGFNARTNVVEQRNWRANSNIVSKLIQNGWHRNCGKRISEH